MQESVVPAPKRRRGRPRAGDSATRDTSTRERIVHAAIDEFGEAGYDGATMRAIAARAKVDAALVHHYFGTKADLFGEVVEAPMRPDVALREILAGQQDQVGARIVRFLLETWDQPDVQRRGAALLRTAFGNRLTTPLLAGFLSREVIGRIAHTLDGDDAQLRASLVASQIAGLIVARYVIKLPALAAASIDELVERVGPNVQTYLYG